MQLEDIIKEIIEKRGYTHLDEIPTKDLIPYYYHLINCDYFSSVEWLDLMVTDETDDIDFITYKAGVDDDFGGCSKLIIKSMQLTPPIHDLDTLRKRPENSALISPLIYDTTIYTPLRYITVWFDPSGTNHGKRKYELMSKFEDVVDNPEKYLVPPTYGLYITYAKINSGGNFVTGNKPLLIKL